LLVAVLGCAKPMPPASEVSADVVQATEREDALAVLDGLEGLIAQGRDTEQDRVYAYERVKASPDDGTAGWAFARGALAGRVAELRGAAAGKLVAEAERYARLADTRDAEFRDGAPRRMLGTLYVKAPGRLVEHGDAEDGLAILEDLTETRPDDPRNHLRLAEAYVHLGDPDPARPHLCRTLEQQASLRPDERRLLASVVEEVGGAPSLGCENDAGG
jgi:hypothetical protein